MRLSQGGLPSPLNPQHLRLRRQASSRGGGARRAEEGLRALCKNRGGMLKAAGVYSLRGSESKGNSPLQEHTPVARVMQRKPKHTLRQSFSWFPPHRSRKRCYRNDSFPLFGSPQSFRRTTAANFAAALMATSGGISYIDCRSGHLSIRYITRGREKGF